MTGPGLETLLGRLERVKRGSKGFSARCPAHDDKTASLSIAEGDDRVLVHCFAGCAPASVLASVGMELADLFDNARTESPAARRQDVAQYLSIAAANNPGLGYDVQVVQMGLPGVLAGNRFETEADAETFAGSARRVLAVLDQFMQLRKYQSRH